MATAGPVTAQRWNRPPIRMVDSKTGEKIRLRLRHMSFSRELKDLPSDMLEVHELFVEQRGNRNANTYMMVAAWNKLRVHDKYWTSFKFPDEPEYLSHYGLPDGKTLGQWTVMVNFFDKATFVLLGDEVLNYMMRIIDEHQKDTDKRKEDYQAIFDLYCTGHESFDKTTFYSTIRGYVEQKYEKPLAKAQAVSLDEWKRQQAQKSRGTAKRRKLVAATTEAKHQSVAPRVEHDLSWERETCAGCEEKATLIEVYEGYVAKLEQVIRKKLGAQHLPKRPLVLGKS